MVGEQWTLSDGYTLTSDLPSDLLYVGNFKQKSTAPRPVMILVLSIAQKCPEELCQSPIIHPLP
jgi:hypothetical protein